MSRTDARAGQEFESQPRRHKALAPDALRWRCDPASLPFETTDEIEPVRGVVGQDAAVEALRFGLECYAPGQNIFVRGLTGTGRMTLIRQLLEEIKPACPLGQDRIVVHNFEQPNRPVVMTLPRGTARRFERMIDDLVRFIEEDLAKALSSELVKKRLASIESNARHRAKEALEPFEDKLKKAGLAVVVVQTPQTFQTALYPLVDGRPVSPEEFEQFHRDEKVSDTQYEAARAAFEEHQDDLRQIDEMIREIQRENRELSRKVIVTEARRMLTEMTEDITKAFSQEKVKEFIAGVVNDVVDNHLPDLEQDTSFVRRYRVNVLISREKDAGCPVVVENSPTMTALLGSIDRQPTNDGALWSDHLMVRPGALLEADGGYLLLEVRDVLREPGAWSVLMRTLRTSRLEIVPHEMQFPWLATSLKPEPIEIEVKVVLLGDAEMYYLLDSLDPDFPQLFKVLADFDSVIPRDEKGIGYYASVLAKIAKEDELPPFRRDAIAMLIEHGARIAARAGKLTARFNRLADIAREAGFIVDKAGRRVVTADDIRETVRRTRRRADLPSRRFREYLADGTIQVQTQGAVVGQVNGLAVIHAGPLTYGFPNRITATIGPGTAGVINIEREAELSGSIHTKGFYILGGLLRSLLQTDHPLAFDGSIAFEQSYGGIDGDSASGAEICCLLSALTGVPIRQDLAMTGAIDQHGHIQAVGAVNEKIEGFFDVCRDGGLTGTQGVIIPESNAGDLMLREDVIEAARQGRFEVYPVATVHEALEILTGRPAGQRDEGGSYRPDSVLGIAVQRARQFWQRAARKEGAISKIQDDGD